MDADRKTITWEQLYGKIYRPSEWDFWKLFDFGKIDDHGTVCINRSLEDNTIKPCYRKFAEQYRLFKISGDADFGLKDTRMSKEAHKFPNFSIMPVTGGMNNRKGYCNNERISKCMDHFPLFLFRLSQFWAIKDEKRLDYVKEYLWFNPHKEESSAHCLMDYLSFFSGINEYTQRIYFIDKEFTKELCEFGKNCNGNDKGEKYFEMASRYFDMRKKLFIEKYGVNPQFMNYDIDSDEFS